jgi:hypothetical protein
MLGLGFNHNAGVNQVERRVDTGGQKDFRNGEPTLRGSHGSRRELPPFRKLLLAITASLTRHR